MNVSKVSKYFNIDAIKAVVENGFKITDFEIVTTEVEAVTSPGDCYTSSIYRIFVTVAPSKEDQRKIQFVIKHLTDLEQGSMVNEFMEVYEKELFMLKEIGPKLSKITNGIQFIPRFYHSLPGSEAKMIAMEDMKALQYRMLNRKEGLDYEHCCLTLRKLGQMHAASMVMVQDDPSLMDKYNFGLYHGTEGSSGFVYKCLYRNFPMLCEITKTMAGFENISRKLERMKDNFWDIVSNSVLRKKDGYRVLAHGDLWTNNIQFKYNDTGKPIDVRFIDFQHTFYTSPANDLHYFLTISPQYDVRESRRDDLLRTYYDSFASNLSELNYQDIPTFENFQEEMRKKEMLSFMAAIFVLPFALMEKQSSKGCGNDGLIDVEAGEEMIRIMLTGKLYTKVIKFILKRCDGLGLFDF